MISKVVGSLLLPFPLAFVLWAVSLVLAAAGRKRAALVVGTLGFLELWALSTPVAAVALAGPLERRYPGVAAEASPTAGAIVVLGGSVASALPPRTGPELVDASDRLLHAARLFRAGKAPVVVASGGRLPWSASSKPESDEMARLLIEWGVARDAILVEGGSTTSAENAAGTAKLLGPRGVTRILLVTSALHMPRAVATFRRAGFEVVPSPTDYDVVAGDQGESGRRARAVLAWLPATDALDLSRRALRERLGLLYYRIRGWA